MTQLTAGQVAGQAFLALDGAWRAQHPRPTVRDPELIRAWIKDVHDALRDECQRAHDLASYRISTGDVEGAGEVLRDIRKFRDVLAAMNHMILSGGEAA